MLPQIWMVWIAIGWKELIIFQWIGKRLKTDDKTLKDFDQKFQPNARFNLYGLVYTMLTQSLWKTLLVHRKAKSNKQTVFELTSFSCTISSTIWTCSFTSFQPFIDTICMIFMTTWQRFCIFTTHFIPTNATLTVLLAYFQQMLLSLFKFLFVFIVQVSKFFVVS